MPILQEFKVTFPELITRVGGKMAFTVDELERQLDLCDGLNEDFPITVGDDRYIVPVGAIREYFATHQRPNKPMNKDQEIEMLRRKVVDLENSLAADKVRRGPVEPTDTAVPVVTLEDVISEGQAKMDERDPGAPAGQGPRETPDQIGARLKKELQASGVKPITRNTPAEPKDRGGL